MSRVNVVTVGGCGQNVGSDVIKTLKANGDISNVTGFRLYSSDDTETESCSFDPSCFDVSYRFKSTEIGGKDLKGSGGDRKANFGHYVEGVKEFINSLKNKPFDKDKDDSVNIVIFSGSKGTGSTGGPILMKYLLESKVPFFAVLVVDNTDELTIINCVNTLQTINGVAKNTKTNPLVYIGENNVNNKKETDVNADVCSIVEAMALMGTGKFNGLDEADYISFVDVTKYSNLFFEPSAMVLSVINDTKDEYGNDTMNVNTNLKPAVVRHIINKSGDTHPVVKSKHGPIGVLGDKNISLVTPLALANCYGIQNYIDRLDAKYNEISIDFGKQKVGSSIGSKLKEQEELNKERLKELEDENVEMIAKKEDGGNNSTDDDEWSSGFIL